ncbi:MAG: PQQ-binding-like beta-propeller repeat protein [Planctomycetota bacterium]|mgnify:CR=1 FL=1
MRLAILLAALAAVPASGQAVQPRWVERSPDLVAAEQAVAAGHALDAVDRFTKILDDPETVDLFLGNPERLATIRGLRAAARDRAREWARENERFGEAWAAEAASRLSRLGPRAGRAGLEKVASLFRGTPAAQQALRTLAGLAWDEGEPGRAAELMERSGLEMSPAEAARLALGRRAAGLGPSAGEWARRWETRGAAGLRPRFPKEWFPALDAPLRIRGRKSTLGAFLDTLRRAPRAPWHGELNAGETPFPPLRSLQGPPQVVTLFELLPPNANALGGAGIVFRDPGAYAGASPIRLLPFEKRVIASTRGGLSVLERGADGKWRVAGGAKAGPPLATHGLATDGRRLFTLVPEPGTKLGAVRLLPAAFVWSGSELKLEWMAGMESGGSPFDGAWAAGPPALAGGRLYVPVALVDSAFVPGVICLDAATGERLWATTLGEATREAFSATSRISASAPAVAGELVLVATGQGFVVALDAATGNPDWLRAYSSDGGQRAFADAPPRVSGGRAIFAPLDLSAEFRLDLATGLPLSNAGPAALPSFHYSVTDGACTVLCGSDGALAGEGGPRGIVKVLNSRSSRDVLYELPDPPAGRPAVWGGTLYVPTARGLITMDVETGEVAVVAEWKTEEAGDLVRLPGGVAVVKGGEVRFWEVSE